MMEATLPIGGPDEIGAIQLNRRDTQGNVLPAGGFIVEAGESRKPSEIDWRPKGNAPRVTVRRRCISNPIDFGSSSCFARVLDR